MKYKVGNKVKLKDNLCIGLSYWNCDRSAQDVFTEGMARNSKKEFDILEIVDNKYILDNSYYSYTCDMLEIVDEVEVFNNTEYVYNEEVEQLLNHMLRLIPQQLIDDALDRRDEDSFYKLVNKI